MPSMIVPVVVARLSQETPKSSIFDFIHKLTALFSRQFRLRWKQDDIVLVCHTK